MGEIDGNIVVSEKMEIRDGGAVAGDILAPRVAIEEGAYVRDSVEMQREVRRQRQES